MKRFIYNVLFSIINLIDAVFIFITLGYKNTGLPMEFARQWALRDIKKKMKDNNNKERTE